MNTNKRNRLRTTQITAAALLTVALLLTPIAANGEAASAAASAKEPLADQSAAARSAAAAAPDAFDPAEVKAFVDGYFAKPEVAEKLAGALVVVVKDDKVLLNQGYGYADVASKKPIDPETTLFRMASISKSITATAAMQLIEQGKIDLNKDVSAYMPDIQIKNDTGVPVTTEHLLVHTAGFDYTDVIMQGDNTELKDFILENVPTVVRKPGEAYRYDNLGYNLLGYIVQSVSGEPFDQYVDRHIFAPLNMKHSTFLLNDKATENLATGYDIDKQPHEVYPMVPTIAPDGGMLSSGSDIANFLIAHLNGGQLNGSRILEERTEKLMQTIQYEAAPGAGIMTYGFESFLRTMHNGQYVVGKGGDLPGYHSWLWMLPEQNVGGMVIVNSDASTSIREDFFEEFMNHYYPKKLETKPAIKLTYEQLAQFEGVYSNLRIPMFATQVKAKDGVLIVQDGFGTHTLRPIGQQLFEDENGVVAAFKADDRGEIRYLYYKMEDSVSEKLSDPGTYDDVATDSPYSESIYYLRTLDAFDDRGGPSFHPESAMTRGDFVSMIARLSGLKPSTAPDIFRDMQGHRQAALIQTAAELGILTGTTDMKFEPDRAITRQEAAAIMWRLVRNFFGSEPIEASLSTAPAPWASEAVQYIVASGMYGPEVKKDATGAVDFMPGEPLLRQEAAAILVKLIQNMFA